MEKQPVSILKTRRDFIRQAACAALGTAGLTSAIRDLRFINAAMAQTAITDYKALVCIFMAGGNDSNNMIIPTIRSEYNNYASIRTPVLALPLSGSPNNVLPVSPLNSDGHEYGFHPAMPELVALFGEGKLATLFNTGTLVFPMTRAQYESGILETPPQLFSHADQVTQWQTSIPDQPPATGWAGRCADLLAAVQPNAPISLSVTLAGANTLEVGNFVSQYSVSTSGAIAISGMSGARLQTVTNVLGLPYPNMQAQAFAKVAEHALNTSTTLNNAILNTAAANYWNVPFPTSITSPTGGNAFGSSLSPQLKMVARLIEAGNRSVGNKGFGMKRQIFFCEVGGYDTHTNQTTGTASTTTGSQANLLAELSQSLFAFQRAMEQLGLSQNVTAFTSSDFGRTFPSNASGTDHEAGQPSSHSGRSGERPKNLRQVSRADGQWTRRYEHGSLDSHDGH